MLIEGTRYYLLALAKGCFSVPSLPISSKSPHFCRWIAIFQKPVIKPVINRRFTLKWRLISDFPLNTTKNRQCQRFYRDVLARLIVRFYRDKIVDFHSNQNIANITRKCMISFIFSCHYISKCISLRIEPLWLCYSPILNALCSLSFDSGFSWA